MTARYDVAVELARELVCVDRLNREKGSDAAAKSVLSEMFRNQGAFVGGGPSYTIEKAAEDVVGIIQRMQHDSSTLELTQQMRSEKLRLEALLQNEKMEKEKAVEAVAEAVAEKEKAVAEAVAQKLLLIATLEHKLEEVLARDEEHKDAASSSSKAPSVHGDDDYFHATRFSYPHYPPKYLDITGESPNQPSTCNEIDLQ